MFEATLLAVVVAGINLHYVIWNVVWLMDHMRECTQLFNQWKHRRVVSSLTFGITLPLGAAASIVFSFLTKETQTTIDDYCIVHLSPASAFAWFNCASAIALASTKEGHWIIDIIIPRNYIFVEVLEITYTLSCAKFCITTIHVKLWNFKL